jgi:hypothetical protein
VQVLGERDIVRNLQCWPARFAHAQWDTRGTVEYTWHSGIHVAQWNTRGSVGCAWHSESPGVCTGVEGVYVYVYVHVHVHVYVWACVYSTLSKICCLAHSTCVSTYGIV